MKHLVSVAAFAASANALVGRADSCCFKLTASGGASGTLGQLGDGQNRIGDSSLPPATYCIDSKGSITDASGRGCILTPPTTQFQCDQGATPTPGFSINSQGQLEYKGSTSFVACETGQNGGMNIYTTNSEDITQCTKVKLSADSCAGSGAGGGAPSSPSAGASSAPGVSASSVPGGGAGGAPGASPSSMPGGGASSVPGGGAGGFPGASPSSAPGAGSSSVPGGGAGGFPGGSPSGPMGSASTGVVSVMTPGSSSPGAGGAGGGPMTQSPGPESSPGGAGGMGGGAVKTTIVKTQTVAVCPQTSTPAACGAGGVPSGPGAGGAGGGAPSSTPSVPGAGGAGGAPTGPSGGGAGGVPSGSPSGPGAGGVPTGPSGGDAGGAPSGPSGGAQPSGPSGGGAGGGPSGPGAGGQPSGTPSAPGGGSQPSGTAPGGASCPTNLSGDYEYPHLIIPVDSSAPTKAPGTSFNGTVTDTVSSIFNFDIPKSDSGKTCSLVFLFPEQQDLETSAFSFSGNGKVDVAMLSGDATSKTSYSNKPSVKKDYGEFTISPGNSYLISTFKCPAGETVSYEMSNAGTTNLDFFQDYNPSPLGMYITVC